MKETEKLVKSLNSKIEILWQKVNLADRNEIYKAADETKQFLDGNSPFLVVNNAGIVSGNEGFLGVDDSKVELEMKINTLAHVWIAKTFVPRMVSTKKGGHFVNIVSLAAYVSSGDLPTYSMSKKGAKGFSEGMNAELKLKGFQKLIKTTCVCPGHILTDLFQGFDGDGKSMTAEYVAKQVIEAIECEKELVCLPKNTRVLPIIIGVSEALGYLNLPFLKDFNPMKQWKGKQSNRIYSTLK